MEQEENKYPDTVVYLGMSENGANYAQLFFRNGVYEFGPTKFYTKPLFKTKSVGLCFRCKFVEDKSIRIVPNDLPLLPSSFMSEDLMKTVEIYRQKDKAYKTYLKQIELSKNSRTSDLLDELSEIYKKISYANRAAFLANCISKITKLSQ